MLIEKLPITNKNYAVQQDSSYVFSMLYGSEPVKLTDIQISERYEQYFSANIREDNPTNADFKTKSNIRDNQRMSVKIGGEVVENGTIIQQSITIYLCFYQDVQSVKIGRGIDQLNAEIDRRSSWTVQSSGDKSADLSSTALEVSMEEGVPRNTVEIAYSVKGLSGRIGVIPKARAPIGKIATLRLYRKDYLPTDENYYIKGGTVDLYVTEPEKIKAATPTVKLKAADDLKLTLELGGFDQGATDVSSCREVGQYFRIVVISSSTRTFSYVSSPFSPSVSRNS